MVRISPQVSVFLVRLARQVNQSLQECRVAGVFGSEGVSDLTCIMVDLRTAGDELRLRITVSYDAFVDNDILSSSLKERLASHGYSDALLALIDVVSEEDE